MSSPPGVHVRHAIWVSSSLATLAGAATAMRRALEAPSWGSWTATVLQCAFALYFLVCTPGRLKFNKLTGEARAALTAAKEAHTSVEKDALPLIMHMNQHRSRVQVVKELLTIAEAKTTAAENMYASLPDVRLARWGLSLATVRTAGGLAEVALALAGRRREESRIQWMDQLAGAPEDGIVVTPGMRLRYSFGFVIAALRYRISDITVPAWRLIDWTLSAHSRTNFVIVSAVGAQIIYIQWIHGLDTLLTAGWAWCGGCGGTLVGLALWLRNVRGIKPADGRQQEQ